MALARQVGGNADKQTRKMERIKGTACLGCIYNLGINGSPVEVFCEKQARRVYPPHTCELKPKPPEAPPK